MPELVLVGLDHRTASVGLRERLSVRDQQLPETIASLRRLPSIDGAAILSTCNRVEAIVSARSEDVIESIVDWLAVMAGCGREELEMHLCLLRGADVAAHFFRVAAGLESMIIGEPQIGGQVRNAFQA